MMRSTYVVALGSNRRGRHGAPAAEVAAAIRALPGVVSVAPIITSAPVGPSIRRFANTAAIVSTSLSPANLLRALKAIERQFGRRRGRRWGARVIDLDIILWSGGKVDQPDLKVPHPAFRTRDFVLAPLVRLAPAWRDPVTGLTMVQLHARLTRRRSVPRRVVAGAGP
ncbi:MULTISPECIES: 2-amino-4-hydroxy-6-hydroxymethyldihydropteridine diphosphokinase [unclassified Sphingomonas]|uniref:2-amino-4-hydroxy-6- hydroxymethyldihydropteridine diphosphokinase n=1 Tax=unclassified Sphingomonas TaxID=196159 RepID=UPI001D11B2E6|nr:MULTISPECIES: 2-amino-4-hydroxy-6-hydroxymethyldihydropteridine diphosphokinase [unclassified Sphingomonas]MCC2981284.1 2-amino-4-hydroxy-6-hydroxymethyldihydropteridine diphosphokinase [Sphingomonas sp. IC4-52]MCD2316995.1 2-amino-4-hydroxy-6-hydroxymethyldihydropteridine diphosphokinase [Sphingomonas sp. IC-11]